VVMPVSQTRSAFAFGVFDTVTFQAFGLLITCIARQVRR
jgi:hypothetical protein